MVTVIIVLNELMSISFPKYQMHSEAVPLSFSNRNWPGYVFMDYQFVRLAPN